MNIKNKIYDEYLSGKIHESDLIIKLDQIQEKTVKEDGVIYTPWDIVQKMIAMANPTINMNIIEPSCGHGIFLIGLLDYFQNTFKLNGEELFQWFNNKVTGVEISQNTINELKEILSVYFLKHFNLKITPNQFSNIYCHDGLTFQSEKHFDLCIGNPPYIRAKNLEADYLKYLKSNYISCKKGTIDIYFAFIEKYSNFSDNLVFITPNSFLTSNAGLVLRNAIMDKLTLLIDFKEKKIFKDASVYTCIFKTISVGSTAEFIYGNEIDKTEIKNKSDIFGQLDNDDGLVSNVLSGIATLCDSVYKVKKAKDGNFYAIYNSITYPIERDIVVPYLKLTKVKSSEDISNIDYMIYPYNDDKTIIEEDILKEKFPLVYNYFLAVKNRLSQRDKGKTDKYESWYAYGRKQGLHNITENYVIVVPQMIGGECKPHKIDISNLLDDFGKIVFTSGFIIPQNQENKVASDYILDEQFIEFAKKNGKVWPGKDENYYSLTAKQIKKFKV